jgi:hypothetical protein
LTDGLFGELCGILCIGGLRESSNDTNQSVRCRTIDTLMRVRSMYERCPDVLAKVGMSVVLAMKIIGGDKVANIEPAIIFLLVFCEAPGTGFSVGIHAYYDTVMRE